MRVHPSRTAFVSVVLLGAAGAVSASFGACATGGTGAQSSGDDASTDSSGSGADSSSSSGSSSGGGGGGTCDANTQTDWTNCGSCGHVCPTGNLCNAGQCQAPCASPTSVCPGQPGCFDLTKDMQNCGTCGTQCLPPPGGTVVGTAMCAQSQCQFTCPTDAGVADGGGPIVQCGGDSGTPGCFDLTSSSDHCGSCGSPCSTGQTCTQSKCCPSGQSYCGGACIDTTTSPTNCGACNAACPSPAQCNAGKCTGYTTTNPTAPFIDACTLAGHTTTMTNAGSWTSTQLLTLPFPFTFYGTSETQYWLQSQGTMGIGPPKTGIFTPMSYPVCGSSGAGDPSTKYAAAVAFGDQSLATGAAGVCYATLGTAPSQQFVATWEMVTLAGDPGSVLTFSIVLTQTTNTVDFMYQTVAGADGGLDPTVAGANATVGMQAVQGTTLVYTPVSCNATFITKTPLDVRLTPVP